MRVAIVAACPHSSSLTPFRSSIALQAQLGVFLLSAVFHEVLVCVPLHMFKWWAFAGMLVQVPFVLITDRYARRG